MPKRNPKNSPLAKQRREAKQRRKESNPLVKKEEGWREECHSSENVLGMPKQVNITITPDGEILANVKRSE